MPVARDDRTPARQALFVGLGGLLGVVAVVFLITQADRLFGATNLDIQIGDGIFRPGPVEELADGVAENGPLLLSDPSGGDRDLYLSHDGGEPSEGWRAFAARAPTAPRDCFAEWQADEEVFVDRCDGTRYPVDGEGLPQYPVSVDAEGILAVDLSAAPVLE